MDPPVASDRATEIRSLETMIIQQYCNALKNASRNVKLHHKPDAVDEPEKFTDSATISNSTLLLPRPLALALMKVRFRRILVSISTVKDRSASDTSSSSTDSGYSSYSQEGTSSISEVSSQKKIQDLRDIADQMIAAGHSRDCIEIYTSVRKTDMDKWFKKLVGIERMSSKDIQRLEWQAQQKKILLWLHAAKTCVRGLFAGERTLANQIFNGLGTKIAEDCFVETVKGSAIKLFDFMEAVINSSRKSPQKLFKIVDLYAALSDLMTDIGTIFGSKSGESIRKQAAGILSSLSEAAREILSEFEKAVFGEISRAPIPEGSVHPMTIYVMNYIADIVEHEQTLTRLIASTPSSSDYISSSELDFDFSEFEGTASPLVLHLVWIIVVLKFNLEGKSKRYKDTSLAHLFMTNNVDYIVQEIKVSVALRQMIGDDYQNKLICLAEATYHKSTGKRILNWFIAAVSGKLKVFHMVCKAVQLPIVFQSRV